MNYGANQYRRSEGGALPPRETEAAAFVFVNRLMIQEDNADVRMAGLVKNQQLWSLLLKDVGNSGNRLPAVLKDDLARLGFWMMRQTIAAMGDRQRRLLPLIEVNDDMIAALRANSSITGPLAHAGFVALAG